MYYYYQSMISSDIVIRTDEMVTGSVFSGTVISMSETNQKKYSFKVGDEFSDNWNILTFRLLTEQEVESRGYETDNSKKYTVIYSDFFSRGSHGFSLVKIEYIECEPEKIKETLESKNIEMTMVNFILNGHVTEFNH